MISPEQFLAKCIDWQFFASLTFKGNVPSEEVRNKMLFAWLRWFNSVEKASGRNRYKKRPSPERDIYWMMREELGEVGGRLHYHVLLGGLSRNLVNVRTAMASCARWEQLHGGSARNYVFDSHLNGVDYVLKGLDHAEADLSKIGAIDYEMAKFQGSDGRRVFLGNQLMWKLLVGTSHKSRIKARTMRAFRRGS